MFDAKDVRTKLHQRLNTLAADLWEKGGSPDTVWTTEIKKILFEMAPCKGDVHVCSSGGGADYGEWLFDVVWMKYSGEGFTRPLKRLLLAAECEWGNRGDILDDFEKLLVCRADIRVMLFDTTKHVDKDQMIGEMKRFAGAYENILPDDRFIFACYVDGQRIFETVEWSPASGEIR